MAKSRTEGKKRQAPSTVETYDLVVEQAASALATNKRSGEKERRVFVRSIVTSAGKTHKSIIKKALAS